MHSNTGKNQENESLSVAGGFSPAKAAATPGLPFADDRPDTVTRRELQTMANGSEQVKQLKTIQQMADQRSRQARFGSVNNSSSANILQRHPAALDNEGAKALGSFYSTDHQGKDDDDYTGAELDEIKEGVFTLTDLAPEGMAANCIGWAQNSDSIEPPGSVYTWTHADHAGYTATEADAADATIILWGDKRGTDDQTRWDIQHASVLLTHDEIASRSGEFGGFDAITAEALAAAGVPNPCWTSVGGFGFGAIVHPRDWLEGGDFGTALIGLK